MTVSAFSTPPDACSRCAIRNRALCSALPPVELSALNSVSRRRSYEAGQVIVTEGDNDVIGNLVSGLLVEKKTLADGREQIISLLFPGDFHGNMLGGRADMSVHAIAPSVVCTFDRAAFERLVDGFPSLKTALLDYASNALAEARSWMLLLGQKTASERVATFLLRLASHQAEVGCPHRDAQPIDDGLVIEIPVTRSLIAAYLGLTLETVSRRLTAFRDQKLIQTNSNRTIKILNVQRLRQAAGELDTI